MVGEGQIDVPFKIESAILATRNVMPGRSPRRCTEAIAQLGQYVARTMLECRTGEAPARAVTVDDLLYLGMEEVMARALVGQELPDNYVACWTMLEAVRDATIALAAPDILEAMATIEPTPIKDVESLGPLKELLFGRRFSTMEEATHALPTAPQLLEAQLRHLATARHEAVAVATLIGGGWGRITAGSRWFANPTYGLLCLGSPTELERVQMQSMEAAAGHAVEAIREAGHSPVRWAEQVWEAGPAWRIDGAQSTTEKLEHTLPPKPLRGQVRSVVGLIRAGLGGIVLPRWAGCPQCESVRVEAGRLELQQGKSQLQVVRGEPGTFPLTQSQGGLAATQRSNTRVTRLARVLRCRDCGFSRLFPGDPTPLIPGLSLPERMSGQKMPRGIRPLLAEWSGDRLARSPLPVELEAHAATLPEGSTMALPDSRLTYRRAFRLPDNLEEFRHMRDESGWRAAIDRTGKGDERVLTWELRAPVDPTEKPKKILFLTREPVEVAELVQQWIGPVDDWIPLTQTAWSGRMVACDGAVELIVALDVLGGSFHGDSTDLQMLEELLSEAVASVYVGTRSADWDDAGLFWLADDGNLAAFVSPNGSSLEGLDAPVLDARSVELGSAVYHALHGAVDPESRPHLKRIQDALQTLYAELDPASLESIYLRPDLMAMAVVAVLTHETSAWLLVVDCIQAVMAEECGASGDLTMLRSAQAERRLLELGIEPRVALEIRGLLEHNERMRFMTPLTRWLQPVLSGTPDPTHVARLRAVVWRTPHIADVYRGILGLANDLTHGERVDVRGRVLAFWKAIGVRSRWSASGDALPGPLAKHDLRLQGRRIVVIGAEVLEDGTRIGRLLAGVRAPVQRVLPDPSLEEPVLVVDPVNPSLVQLEQRALAGNLTVLVTQNADEWRYALPAEHAAFIDEPDMRHPGVPELDGATLNHLLPGLHSNDLVDLISLMHTLVVQPGETIARAGQRMASCAWVRMGSVDMGGVLLDSGAMLGGTELFAHEPSLHDIVAQDTVLLDVLPLEAFDMLHAAGFPAVQALERSAVMHLAHQVARRPTADLGRTGVQPTPFGGDWTLYWPALDGKWGEVPVGLAIPALEGSRAVVYDAGDVLYGTGDEGDFVWLLLTGKVEVGGLQMHPGSLLGVVGLLLGHQSHEAIAVSEAHCLMIPAAVAHRFWNDPDPVLRLSAIESLAPRR